MAYFSALAHVYGCLRLVPSRSSYEVSYMMCKQSFFGNQTSLAPIFCLESIKALLLRHAEYQFAHKQQSKVTVCIRDLDKHNLFSLLFQRLSLNP